MTSGVFALHNFGGGEVKCAMPLKQGCRIGGEGVFLFYRGLTFMVTSTKLSHFEENLEMES